MKKILVVDDETEILELIKKSLERTGEFLVTTTSDPKAVHDLCRTFSPDLVVLDLVMPEMEGTQVVRALKDDLKTAGIRIIITSGLGEIVYHQKGEKWSWEPNRKIVAQRSHDIKHERSAEKAAEIYGVDDYIAKPFSAATLLAVIKDVLARVPPEEPPPGEEENAS